MIEVDGLTVRYGDKVVVNQLAFRVRRGGALALLGPSGSGKSTTALAVAGLCRGVVTGAALIDGRPVDASMRGGAIGFVFQEPALALDPVFRIGQQIEEVALLHGQAPDLAARLAEVGLAPALVDRFPNQLSGGQRQRAAIAIALAGKPDVLIADEPTSALDSVSQANVLDLLDSLRRDRKLTLLLITHDRAVAERVTDEQRWMAAGALVDAPPPPVWPSRAPAAAAGPGLEARGLAVHVRVGWFGRKPILAPLDLTVRRGSILGVVGASGSGKTTLGRALAGFTPHAGTIELMGAPLRDRRRIQLVHQDPGTALDPRFSVGATLREAGGDPVALLADVGLGDVDPRTRSDRLSGGQKQRVAIARAIASRPEVLVLDEALSALDPDTAASIVRLLLDLRSRRGTTLIFISHDVSVVRRIADDVLVLEEARVVDEGPVDTILDRSQVPATRALVDASSPRGDRGAPPSL